MKDTPEEYFPYFFIAWVVLLLIFMGYLFYKNKVWRGLKDMATGKMYPFCCDECKTKMGWYSYGSLLHTDYFICNDCKEKKNIT